MIKDKLILKRRFHIKKSLSIIILSTVYQPEIRMTSVTKSNNTPHERTKMRQNSGYRFLTLSAHDVQLCSQKTNFFFCNDQFRNIYERIYRLLFERKKYIYLKLKPWLQITHFLHSLEYLKLCVLFFISSNCRKKIK